MFNKEVLVDSMSTLGEAEVDPRIYRNWFGLNQRCTISVVTGSGMTEEGEARPAGRPWVRAPGEPPLCPSSRSTERSTPISRIAVTTLCRSLSSRFIPTSQRVARLCSGVRSSTRRCLRRHSRITFLLQLRYMGRHFCPGV